MKRKIIICLISIVIIVGITLLLIFAWNKGKENIISSRNVQEQVVEENTKEEVLEEIANAEINTNEENKEQDTNENDIKDTEDEIKNTEDKEIKEEIITKTQQEQVVKNINTEEKNVVSTKTQEQIKQPQTTKEEVKKESNTTSVIKTEEKTTTINQNNNNTQNNNQNINNISNNNQNEKNNTENTSNSTVQPTQKDEKKFVKNAEYIAKMKTYLEKNSKREITVVEDASIIELTTGFTYSEFNLSAYTNKAGIVKIYARDYYVNGQYMYTQCYVL